MNEIEKKLNQYFNAKEELCNILEDEIYDPISDHRDDKWSGDVESPYWEWIEECKDWNYGAEGICSIVRDGLVFIYCRLCTGDKEWLVFRESNIIKTE